MPVDSAVTMAARQAKAQNLQSWKREASRCLHHSCCWASSVPAEHSDCSYKRCFDCSETGRTFLPVTNHGSGARVWLYSHRCFPVVFFLRRRHVPWHLQGIFPHGVPQPGEAEEKERALPTLLQVVTPSVRRRNKIPLLEKCCSRGVALVPTSQGGPQAWSLNNLEKP